MSRFWRLLETGLRFCAHTGGVQDKKAVAVRGIGGSGMDRVVLEWIVQCSWISWIGYFVDVRFRRRLWQYLRSFVKYWIASWIYEIYVDLLFAE